MTIIEICQKADNSEALFTLPHVAGYMRYFIRAGGIRWYCVGSGQRSHVLTLAVDDILRDDWYFV
jgi:hypothetical protein